MKVYDSIEGESIFPVLRQILKSVHRPWKSKWAKGKMEK